MRSHSRHTVVAFLALLGIVLSSAPAAAQPIPTPPDRYGSAAAAAFEAFPSGADVAVLASGENFPDALVAAPLAAFYDAPILLTQRASLPAVTAAALVELGVADVIVMGGRDTVSFEISNALELNYQVSRVAGDDRYGTAAQAARDAFPAGAGIAVLASGENFPDALAAAPLAAFYDAPILLTGRTFIPPVTAAALADLGIADVIVLGGPAAVSLEVSNALELNYQVSRVTGTDRYGTAAQAALDAFPAGATVAALASGENFPDALATAPLAAFYDAPILLTGRSSIPPVTAAALADLGVADIIVLGGPDAVSIAVTNALELDYQVTRVAGGSGATRTVQVFFANTSLGAECSDVFPVPRTVDAAAPLRPTLEALLTGPTPAEQALGYGGWFSSATEGMLNDVSIESRVAYADFDDLRPVIPNASTSCGAAGMLSQLESTATQFDTVDDAHYSLVGSGVEFSEWLQMTPPS
ncbi:MAG: cell wall-binding repeat-containing protein [Microbacteriaceae bacterium]|nr:cell wall-binding repeat-containing protein [Microbacteriaceae bacterium]